MQRAALVVLLEQVVTDVRVAGGLGLRERVEVEGEGVRLLQLPERCRLDEGAEAAEQVRRLLALAAGELLARTDLGVDRAVGIREHVGEGECQLAVEDGGRGRHAQNLRSGVPLRVPKPPSRLSWNGSTRASIASSRAIGGITKRSL